MFKFMTSIGVATLSVLGLAAALIGFFLLSTPRPNDLKSCIVTKMYEVRLCPTEPGYVKLGHVSSAARNAIIVSEDAAFYDHEGFDWNELKLSFETNLEKGEFARGGSTISQQLAKNVYLTPEKSLLRKLREALITVQIEGNHTKDEILEKYLNVVEFGQDLYGIGRASQAYFKKPASQLSAAEGAFLAFLLPSPKKYSVSFKKRQLTPFARRQVGEIVDRLHRFKKISDTEHAKALVEIDSLFGVRTPPPAATEGLEPSTEEASEEASDEAPNAAPKGASDSEAVARDPDASEPPEASDANAKPDEAQKTETEVD